MIQEIQQLQTSLAKCKGIDNKSEARLLLAIAQNYLNDRDYANASHYLEEALQISTDNHYEMIKVVSLIRKCELLNVTGNYPSAQALLDKTLILAKNAELHYEIAEVYYNAAVMKNGTLQYEETLALIPKAFQQMKEYEEEITEPLKAVCYWVLAEAHEHLGNLKLAKDAFLECAERFKNVENWEDRAKSLIKIGDMTRSPLEAERYFKEAIEISERLKSDELLANAKLYCGKKFVDFDYDKAEILLTEAMEIADTNKMDDSLMHIYHHLTELYSKKEDYHKLCFFGKELKRISQKRQLPLPYAFVQLVFAEYLLRLENKEEAIKYAQQALNIYQRFGSILEQEYMNRVMLVIKACV